MTAKIEHEHVRLRVKHIGRSIYMKLPPKFKNIENNTELDAVVCLRNGKLYGIVIT